MRLGVEYLLELLQPGQPHGIGGGRLVFGGEELLRRGCLSFVLDPGELGLEHPQAALRVVAAFVRSIPLVKRHGLVRLRQHRGGGIEEVPSVLTLDAETVGIDIKNSWCPNHDSQVCLRGTQSPRSRRTAGDGR